MFNFRLKSLIRLVLSVVAVAGASGTSSAGPVPTNKPSAYPDWWFERDVIPLLPAQATNPTPAWPAHYPVADDYAAANLGQLKAIASKAAAEFNATLPLPGAGLPIESLVGAWQAVPAVGVIRDDFAALNQGQLKAVAKLYYDRLATLGYSSQPLLAGQTYPWTTATTDDDDYALVNIGQLKLSFSFDPGLIVFNPGDSDRDGILDTWEITYFGSIALYSGLDDPDADGLNNKAEYLLATHPLQLATSVSKSALTLIVFSP